MDHHQQPIEEFEQQIHQLYYACPNQMSFILGTATHYQFLQNQFSRYA